MTAPRPDPSAALVAAYTVVAGRMAGLPVVNPALVVEAVDFQRWEGHWLGVVVTPWFMNLTLAPADPACWVPLPVGGKRRLRFPAGNYEFIGASDPAFGDFQVCSLFSPMDRFADQGGARLVASLALQALFDPANAEPAPVPAGAAAETAPQAVPVAGATTPTPAAPAAAAAPAASSAIDEAKRNFLRGRVARAPGP